MTDPELEQFKTEQAWRDYYHKAESRVAELEAALEKEDGFNLGWRERCGKAEAENRRLKELYRIEYAQAERIGMMHSHEDYVKLEKELAGVRAQNKAAQETIYLLEKCVEDYCPQIGATVTLRQYFYHISGHYPEWLKPLERTAHFDLWKMDALDRREALGEAAKQ